MWRSVIREDGHDPRASEALVRLYRAGGKWTALVDLLKDELERLGSGDDVKEQRIAALLEIAALYRDKLRLDTMALATLQRILEVDPSHEESLDALADTYAKAGRHADLLGVYDKRIAAAAAENDTERECELLRKMATDWVPSGPTFAVNAACPSALSFTLTGPGFVFSPPAMVASE